METKKKKKTPLVSGLGPGTKGETFSPDFLVPAL